MYTDIWFSLGNECKVLLMKVLLMNAHVLMFVIGYYYYIGLFQASSKVYFIVPPGPYDKGYPPPSFYNPVPWKPIHAPPPEDPVKNTPQRRPHSQSTKCQSATRSRLRNSASGTRLLQRR